LRSLHPADYHKERVSDLKKFRNELDVSMLNFPVDIDNNTLKKFEAANNLRLFIFEIGKKEGEVYGIYVSDNIECDRIVDLGFYR
jgi:hypothetical protein